jgi:hypothetical protein
MAINTSITTLPTPPSSTDSATFSTRADAFLAALPTLQSQLNSYAGEANSTQTAINASQTAAATSVTNAANQVTLATDQANLSSQSAQVSTAAANFRGAWLGTTAYTVGQSVLFNGQIFIALVNNTNVTPVSGATWILFADLLLARQHAIALSF